MKNKKRDGHIRATLQQPATGRDARPLPVVHGEIRLSFKFVEPGSGMCLSNCNKQEVKEYKNCLKKLSLYTMQQLYSTATKQGGHKKGLHYETFESSKFPPRPAGLDPSIKIGCVRASEKMRLFLAQVGEVFYVLWFDRNHDLGN